MTVYVEAFGAVGDGVADDTDAIQRAIDLACVLEEPVQLMRAHRFTRPLIARPGLRLVSPPNHPSVNAFDERNTR